MRQIALDSGKKAVNYWAWLSVKINRPVFIDDTGHGYIHSNEPFHRKVFGSNYIDVITVEDNKKWNDNEISYNLYKGIKSFVKNFDKNKQLIENNRLWITQCSY